MAGEEPVEGELQRPLQRLPERVQRGALRAEHQQRRPQRIARQQETVLLQQQPDRAARVPSQIHHRDVASAQVPALAGQEVADLLRRAAPPCVLRGEHPAVRRMDQGAGEGRPAARVVVVPVAEADRQRRRGPFGHEAAQVARALAGVPQDRAVRPADEGAVVAVGLLDVPDARQDLDGPHRVSAAPEIISQKVGWGWMTCASWSAVTPRWTARPSSPIMSVARGQTICAPRRRPVSASATSLT